MSAGQGLHRAASRWYNPLKTISGKDCKICGKPATCAVLTYAIHPACLQHAKRAEQLGYDVVYPEEGK